MSINKCIFYQLCNKGIMVNLYKLLFLSSHFSFQPNKRVFHPPTFPSLQPNTHEEKLNIFHPSTFLSSHNFSSFYFSTPPTKQTLSIRASQLTKQHIVKYHTSTNSTNLRLERGKKNTKQSKKKLNLSVILEEGLNAGVLPSYFILFFIKDKNLRYSFVSIFFLVKVIVILQQNRSAKNKKESKTVPRKKRETTIPFSKLQFISIYLSVPN